MQNVTWKVVVGIVIFLGFFTFPIWYSPVSHAFPEPAEQGSVYAYVHELLVGTNLGRPQRLATSECLLDETQKLSHMQILDRWRDEVTRDGHRYLEESRGSLRYKSLTKTCMSSDCHRRDDANTTANGTRVPPCAECHQFIGVEGGHRFLGVDDQGNEVRLFDEVYCWDCHEQVQRAGQEEQR